jgi:hypothetical protein
METSPMDINANLTAMGRYGRAARIGAVVCLLIACILLLVSLASPSGAVAEIPGPQNAQTTFAQTHS